MLYFGLSSLGIVILIYIIPILITSFRDYMLAQIEGDRALTIPNHRINPSNFKKVYTSPQAFLHGKCSRFANLLWYFTAPGAHMYQEFLEDGPRYSALATVTKQVLSIPAKEITELVEKHANQYFLEKFNKKHQKLLLLDNLMPLWIRIFFELIFKRTCTLDEEHLILANVLDFNYCIKFCKLPNRKVRQRLQNHLLPLLMRGEFQPTFNYDFTLEEKTHYVRGVFFSDAITQISEASTHVLLCLAQNQEFQKRFSEKTERTYLNNVIDESMRLFPVFGMAMRIMTEDLYLEDNLTIPKNTVVFFNVPKFHRTHFDHSDNFNPDRWLTLKKAEANFCPFGYSENRSCPAQGFSKIALGTFLNLAINKFEFYSNSRHERQLANRGPCIVVAKGYSLKFLNWQLFKMLCESSLQDHWIKLKQAVLGIWMIHRAKKLSFAEKYFNQENERNQSQTY